ncbi:unnamed protein product [Trichogramma brassicae]|uniref:RNA-directed DNA polymerase n=1 Tax=Trichogramma brassicae TaxID=86971 RepID=A0A6H5ITK0_9HYME|nr:unnamed protein product [Trichogramma brassicae]
MNYLLRDLDFVRCYQDDILVLSLLATNNLQHLRELLTSLKRARLFVNWEKSARSDARRSFSFCRLPHLRARIRATTAKVEAIARFPKPSDSTQLRRFIGMLNFYPPMLASRRRAHVSPHGSSPRTAEEKEKLAWSAQADEAFERIKQLWLQRYDQLFYHPGQPLALHTDASNTAIGAAVESAPRRRRLDAAGFSSRRSYHQLSRGTQQDTRGSKFHHHDRSSPSVLRPRAEVGQVLASTVTSARLHLALRCQDRLHARPTRTQWQTLYISHRRDYDASDAQLAQITARNSRRTNNEHISAARRNSSFTTSRSTDFPFCVEQRDGLKPYPTRESTSTGLSTRLTHSLSSERQSYREASRAAYNFWPSMSKDIVRWAKQCVPCQQSKVHRHNRAELGNFRHTVTRRPIRSVHIDIVKMPLHQGFQKLPHDDRPLHTLATGHPDRRHVCTNRSQSFFSTDGFHFLAHRSRSRLIRRTVRREAPRSAMQASSVQSTSTQPVPSSGK